MRWRTVFAAGRTTTTLQRSHTTFHLLPTPTTPTTIPRSAGRQSAEHPLPPTNKRWFQGSPLPTGQSPGQSKPGQDLRQRHRPHLRAVGIRCRASRQTRDAEAGTRPHSPDADGNIEIISGLTPVRRRGRPAIGRRPGRAAAKVMRIGTDDQATPSRRCGPHRSTTPAAAACGDPPDRPACGNSRDRLAPNSAMNWSGSPCRSVARTPSALGCRAAYRASTVGGLAGRLFHGIQTALFAQQMAARAQLEHMRQGALPGHSRTGSVRAGHGHGTGQYL